MKKVLITGASSGIGLSIAKKLLKEKTVEVVAIARDFSKSGFNRENHLFPYSLDLSLLEKLPSKLSSIFNAHKEISSLILSAGAGSFGKLEQLSYKKMKYLMDLNFLSNAYIVKTFLPKLKVLKKANIIFIGSTAAIQGQKEGTIYCSSKFALRGFAQALREECSNTGVKVSIIQPSYVRTPFYESLHFEPKNEENHSLEAEDIAEIVNIILKSAERIVLDEIIISPQKKSIKFKKN